MQGPGFLLQTPTELEFGLGVAGRVGERATALGIGHALLVTDRGLSGGQAVADALAALTAAGVATTLYDGVIPDPTDLSIAEAAAAYRACGADGLVAVGGGSAMDTAKAVGVLARAGGDDITPFLFGGPGVVPSIPPLICLPTTAGTGAEVTFVSVVTQAMQKKVVRSTRIAPALALVDPALTATMPPALTASTGLDALSHALEALTSRLSSPPCDALALDAAARIARWLPRAVERGDDMEARTELALAATMAGIAFVNARVHLGHAVGHSMGTHFKVAHGFACAMCLPALLAFLGPAAERPLALAAAAMGGDDAAAATASLLEQVGAPRLGRATGKTAADIPQLVEIIQTEGRLIGLSRRAPSPEEWAAIFEQSL